MADPCHIQYPVYMKIKHWENDIKSVAKQYKLFEIVQEIHMPYVTNIIFVMLTRLSTHKIERCNWFHMTELDCLNIMIDKFDHQYMRVCSKR
jgi:hypothetical protein